MLKGARESSWTWVAQSLEETWNTRVEKNAEEKAKGVFHPKCKSERRKVSSMPFLHFFFFSMVFFSLCFFFFSSTWEEKDARRKRLKQKGKNGKAKAGGQMQEPKVKGHSGSLKESLFPSLHFFFFCMVFFSFVFFSFLLLENKKMPRENIWNKRVEARRQKRKGRSGSQKWEGRAGT